MSLDYYLELSTDLKPAPALRRLAERLGLDWADDTHLSGPGTIISAVEVTPGWWTEGIEEGFHFSPRLTVGFHYNKEEEEAFNRIMLRATLLLLEQPGDAVLLFNGEVIVLQRLKGQLVFNADYEMWDDTWLKAEVQQPYEKRSLPSPLL